MAGIVGSVFTTPAISSWYKNLAKPIFNPPNWIFGPVWSVLFLLMGISLYLVLQKRPVKSEEIKIFSIQLGLNVLWTIIFFYFMSPIAAFIEILILWLAIFLTIKAFYKVSKNSAYLLLPYIIWVSFALLLNLSVVVLN